MTELLEAKGIWQRFGGLVANSDVSISVGHGEIVGLIGPNGAGKSTLFNLIAGVYTPTQGSIIFDGEDVTRLSAAERCERGVGRTFQVVKSFETMTVIDNVIVGALIRTTVMREARRKAHEVLEFCGLAARADTLASQLIPSEKRRLEVAHEQLDEPRAVPPFQGQLFVMDDDRVHSRIWLSGYLVIWFIWFIWLIQLINQ